MRRLSPRRRAAARLCPPGAYQGSGAARRGHAVRREAQACRVLLLQSARRRSVRRPQLKNHGSSACVLLFEQGLVTPESLQPAGFHSST